MAGPSGVDDEEMKPRAMITSTAAGYCYSNSDIIANTHLLQSFDPTNPHIYNFSSPMDQNNILGFIPSKNIINDLHTDQNINWNHHHHHHHQNNNRSSFLDQDPISFPSCEGNGTSQGLSLSLNSIEQNHDDDFIRFGIINPSSTSRPHFQFQNIINSKYLDPAQELLNDFCSIGTDHNTSNLKNPKSTTRPEDDSAVSKPPLHSLDLLELHKRKTTLLHMLEEVYILDIFFFSRTDQIN